MKTYNQMASMACVKVCQTSIWKEESIGTLPMRKALGCVAFRIGPNKDNEDDLWMMWKRLQNPETNIYYVGLVLRMEAKKLGFNLGTVTRKERIKVLLRYNTKKSTAYGHHVIKYYDLFKKYNR